MKILGSQGILQGILKILKILVKDAFQKLELKLKNHEF
jgi:hypothetical protein